MHRTVRVLATALATGVLLLAGCTNTSDRDRSTSAVPTTSPTPTSPSTESTAPSASAEADVRFPISVPALFERSYRGDQLRLGTRRENTAKFRSYDVTYRSDDLTVTGVLNVPKGKGPFPAVVLAHGYIDPAVYESGQGMTRERGYLAARGFIAFHVDYRGHAGSDRGSEPLFISRLGYTIDVINAAKALRASDLPVARQRVSVFGRSMGGSVVQKAIVAQPDLFRSAAVWASTSSQEAQNYDQFIADNPPRIKELRGSLKTPDEDPALWRANSSRPYFDRISAPVLHVHGRKDTTCPPRWARENHRAMRAAGVDSTLKFYDDRHAFGPAFNAAMQRTVRFFRGSAR